MDRRTLAATALSAAVGLVLGAQAIPASAQGMKEMPPVVKQNMERASMNHLEKCFGINAVAKNDCAAGAHSCAGQPPTARCPACPAAAGSGIAAPTPGRGWCCGGGGRPGAAPGARCVWGG